MRNPHIACTCYYIYTQILQLHILPHTDKGRMEWQDMKCSSSPDGALPVTHTQLPDPDQVKHQQILLWDFQVLISPL